MENKCTNSQDAGNPKLKGLRMTRQRREGYEVLMGHRDHPTAAEVYERAKSNMPGISLATVYNCLEALVGHGLVKQVNFHDEQSGTIVDVPLKKGIKLSDFLDLPDGAQINNLEITLRGKISNH